MPQLKRGILIAIEGVDGSGKTLLANNLMTSFTDQEFPTLLTAEPGGTEVGKKIRSLLQQNNKICAKSEYLLFAADRAQHFEEIIIPALERNQLIISDRLAHSSLVYQGYGRNLSLDLITTINRWVMNHYEPDLICYVKVDVETAHKRLRERGKPLELFDRETISFYNKLIHGYETILQNKTNVITLDGMQSPEQITKSALTQIIQWLNQHQLLL